MLGNHGPHHKRKHFQAGLEVRSGHDVHFACAADLVAVDDFAHAGDANRLAWSHLLPAGACRFWSQAFLNLEVPDNEGEC